MTTLERLMAELAESQIRTHEEMRAFKDEMRLSSQEADRRWRESLRESLDASERVWRQQWGELSNRMGTLVEDIVAPGIPALFRTVFGFDEIEFAALGVRRRHRTDRGRIREFDYVAMAGDVVSVNETKSTLRPDDVTAFLTQLAEVREFLPETDGRQVVGSLASFYVDPSLVAAAERQGLLMFGMGSGLLQVLNGPGFEPRRF